MFRLTHDHRELDRRLTVVEDTMYRILVGLIAGGFVVIAALIGFIGVLLSTR
jgi:hypothetical protein